MIKTLVYSSTDGKAQTHAGGTGLLASQASSVEATLPSRTRTASHARTHARHEQTRNETETDFPIGVNCVDSSPQSPIYLFIYTAVDLRVGASGKPST